MFAREWKSNNDLMALIWWCDVRLSHVQIAQSGKLEITKGNPSGDGCRLGMRRVFHLMLKRDK